MYRIAAACTLLFIPLLAGCPSGGSGFFPTVHDGGADLATAPGQDLAGTPPMPDLATAAGCNDGVKNGAETDTDCGGGTCAPCAAGRTCLKAGDCQSGFCVNQICAPPQTSCNDNIRNGAETDIDCGGGTCPTCANGKACVAARDCQSGNCTNNVCMANGGNNACRNNIKDGAETDIDCGGGTCFPCGVMRRCTANTDCQSKNCGGGICQQPVAKFGCISGLQCAVQCYSQACVKACQQLMNTPNGQAYFTAAYQCESNGPCPTSGGAVCDVTALNYDYMACQNCVMGQQSLAACMNQLFSCFNDG